MSAVDAVLARIRSHPYGVAGYACLFDHRVERTARGHGPEVIRRGAFASALDHPLVLLVNHVDQAVLARTEYGQLHVAEDDHGLWFEAMLPETAIGARVFAHIALGELSAMSTGSTSTSGVRVNGVFEVTCMALTEISIVVPPSRPGRTGTWVMSIGPAWRRRSP